LTPYDNVAELERQVAEYAGAPYAVAVDSCSNALLISFSYRFACGYPREVILPKYTYVGVAQAVLNAGGTIKFVDMDWQGAYDIEPLDVVDSARRFTSGMYKPGTLYCLSGHWWKHLPVGRAGFILTDDAEAVPRLKRMRYDGRAVGVAPKDDQFTRGYHCYMLPEEAARGLMLMANMKKENPDIPWDAYTDLSQYDVFKACP
jgi:dTDP-4-amino-4,6-dideoxygalactose transaminase